MENLLRQINKSSLKFLKPLSLEDTVKTIVREGEKILGAKYGSIFLSNKSKLYRIYASNKKLYDVKARKRGFVYSAYKSKEPTFKPLDVVSKVHPEISNSNIKNILFIPLSYHNKSNGVLTMHTSKDEQELQKITEALKVFGSLASLAIRNAQLYAQLNKALETRDLFISIASHELKTPLTALSGYIQLLSKKHAHSQTTESKWIELMLKESKRLTNLINELLEVNQIKKGDLQFSFDEINVKTIVEDTVKNCKVMYPKRKITYQDRHTSPKPLVLGDSDKLQQVITNILNNAIKFSEEHKEIKVDFDENKTFFLVRVSDQGIGIPQEDIDKVFNGFYKGSHNIKEGMGLGLYLAKEIVEKHKGQITISSQENTGTTVEIKILKPSYQ